MNKIILVYSTFPTMVEAEKIIQILLEQNLIACANVFPIKSVYRWEGRICNDDEIAVVFKTLEKYFDNICLLIKTHHSYKIPAIIKLEAQAEVAFASWVVVGLQD